MWKYIEEEEKTIVTEISREKSKTTPDNLRISLTFANLINRVASNNCTVLGIQSGNFCENKLLFLIFVSTPSDRIYAR